MTADIFFGVIHYQRLRHMVSDKFQVKISSKCQIDKIRVTVGHKSNIIVFEYTRPVGTGCHYSTAISPPDFGKSVRGHTLITLARFCQFLTN